MRTVLIFNESNYVSPHEEQHFEAALGYAVAWAMGGNSYPVAVLHVLPEGNISACYYDSLEWKDRSPKFAMLGILDHDDGRYFFHS